jgi:hypothetical protein
MMVIDNATRECFLVDNLERHAFLLPSLLASWRLSDVGGSGNEEVRLVQSGGGGADNDERSVFVVGNLQGGRAGGGRRGYRF